MRRFYLTTAILSLLIILGSSCSRETMKTGSYGSIFDHNYTLSVVAESYPEYTWNTDAEKAYELYLRLLNESYYKKDYEQCSIFLYDAIDIYPYDARFYVRLAESLARSVDALRSRDILEEGGKKLTGFTDNPGVRSYMQELNSAIATSSLGAEKSEKGIIGKTLGVFTWPFRKIINLF